MVTPRPWVEVFAPATVSNVGPGFDCLGLALRQWGDKVRARRSENVGAQLMAITGDGGKLPRGAEDNTATVAAAELLRRHAPRAGVELELHKGLPLGSGLGSSGASAAAAVVATDAALQLGLPAGVLIDCAREGERRACGAAHPDNVAPAIMGGVVLVSHLDPLRAVSLPVPDGLWFAVFTPALEVSTAKARAVLPAVVPLDVLVRQSARLGLLVHALHQGDIDLLGEAIVDEVAEPARAPLIPGFLAAKVACLEAGALACSVSGAGPTTFALAASEGRAQTFLAILEEAFGHEGLGGRGCVDQVGGGARVVSPPLH